MNLYERKALLSLAINASIEAGQEILKVYNTDFEITKKEDNSPLTLADMNSHRIIMNYLKETPTLTDRYIPILSEEGKDISYEERRHWEYFWLVDPLDGTKEFIKRNGEFTVNIALIYREKPVMGVIYIPVKDTLYFSSEDGAYRIYNASKNLLNTQLKDLLGSFNEDITQLKNKTYSHWEKPVRLIGSRSHSNPEVEEFISKLRASRGDVEFISAGSSLKFCLIAEGNATIYPRFGPTMEWDTAAGQAIVESSGGRVLDVSTGSPLIYNKRVLKNQNFIVTANLTDELIKELMKIVPYR